MTGQTPATSLGQAVTAAGGRLTLLTAAGLLAVVDMFLKAAAVRVLTEPVDLAVLELRVSYNPGVAFSLGDSLPSVVVLAGTAVITIAMAAFAIRAAPRMNRWSRSGVALILAGAVGNLADRAGDGAVTDYLHTGWFPTFNLADIFITCGAAALLWGSIGETEPEQEPRESPPRS